LISYCDPMYSYTETVYLFAHVVDLSACEIELAKYNLSVMTSCMSLETDFTIPPSTGVI
jgi:hypothetical protein